MIQPNNQKKCCIILSGEKYSKIATKLLAEIGIFTALYPQFELPTYLQVQHLALSIAVHSSASPIQTNAIAHPTGNKTSTGTSPPFQRKNTAKQCACCKMFGHCIDVKDKTDKKDMQVCCIGAQIYHVAKYAEKHKEEMEVNAAMYEGMTTPKHFKYVNKFCKPTSSELEDACEKEFIADLHNKEEMEQDSN